MAMSFVCPFETAGCQSSLQTVRVHTHAQSSHSSLYIHYVASHSALHFAVNVHTPQTRGVQCKAQATTSSTVLHASAAPARSWYIIFKFVRDMGMKVMASLILAAVLVRSRIRHLDPSAYLPTANPCRFVRSKHRAIH